MCERGSGEQQIMARRPVDRPGQQLGRAKASRTRLAAEKERVRGPTRLVNEGGREKAVGLALASSLRAGGAGSFRGVSVHRVVTFHADFLRRLASEARHDRAPWSRNQ